MASLVMIRYIQVVVPGTSEGAELLVELNLRHKIDRSELTKEMCIEIANKYLESFECRLSKMGIVILKGPKLLFAPILELRLFAEKPTRGSKIRPVKAFNLR